MFVKITQYGTTVASSNNMTLLPRVGEKISMSGDCYEVKEVVWHIGYDGVSYIEVKIR